MKTKRYYIGSIFFLILTPTVVFSAMSSESYQIPRSSINIGGNEDANSASYDLRDTVGQSSPPGEATSASYQLQAGYRKMIETSISISAPASVELSPSISGVSGGTGQGSADLVVTTNDPAGYELAVSASSSPALASGQWVFADYTDDGSPDFNFSVPANASEFGFSPEGSDVAGMYLDNGSTCGSGIQETANRCWAGFSTTTETIAERNEAATNGVTTTLKFRARVGADTLQPAGSYQAMITTTATAQ